jgi:hypothetical protein
VSLHKGVGKAPVCNSWGGIHFLSHIPPLCKNGSCPSSLRLNIRGPPDDPTVAKWRCPSGPHGVTAALCTVMAPSKVAVQAHVATSGPFLLPSPPPWQVHTPAGCGHGGTRYSTTSRNVQTCPEMVCQVFWTLVLLFRMVVQDGQSMTIPDVATQQDRLTHHRLLWFSNTETRCVSIRTPRPASPPGVKPTWPVVAHSRHAPSQHIGSPPPPIPQTFAASALRVERAADGGVLHTRHGLSLPPSPASIIAQRVGAILPSSHP